MLKNIAIQCAEKLAEGLILKAFFKKRIKSPQGNKENPFLAHPTEISINLQSVFSKYLSSIPNYYFCSEEFSFRQENPAVLNHHINRTKELLSFKVPSR